MRRKPKIRGGKTRTNNQDTVIINCYSHADCPTGQVCRNGQCVIRRGSQDYGHLLGQQGHLQADCRCPSGTEYITDYDGNHPVFAYNGQCCNTSQDCISCDQPGDYHYHPNEGWTCLYALNNGFNELGMSYMEYYHPEVWHLCNDPNNFENCPLCECGLYGWLSEDSEWGYSSPYTSCVRRNFTGGLGCCAHFLDGGS